MLVQKKGIEEATKLLGSLSAEKLQISDKKKKDKDGGDGDGKKKKLDFSKPSTGAAPSTSNVMVGAPSAPSAARRREQADRSVRDSPRGKKAAPANVGRRRSRRGCVIGGLQEFRLVARRVGPRRAGLPRHRIRRLAPPQPARGVVAPSLAKVRLRRDRPAGASRLVLGE